MNTLRIYLTAATLAATLCAAHGARQSADAQKPAAAAIGEKAPATKTPEPRPVDALSWVVGGVWTADASRLAPGMQRIETRYQWSDNHAYIRFNTHFVFDKGAAKTYDGNLFWNPDKKSLAIWYMDHANSITEGPLQIDGNLWTITFHGPDFAGNPADLRVLITRKTNDDYNWSVAEKQGETWKELAQLEYLRVPGE
jgi:hypothetical protein